MKVKCDYCGSMVEEEYSACPNCGAALNGVNRFADRQPRTIEELKEWYASRNMPPEEVTRFFIGKDVREPRAFGIYQNVPGDFVVYKNKNDGQRAIRYQGSDEAYAVNELYQRLRAEIANQKDRNSRRSTDAATPNNGMSNAERNSNIATIRQQGAEKAVREGLKLVVFFGTIWTIFVVLIVIAMIRTFFFGGPTEGYYRYNEDVYYYQDDSWYYYNDLQDDWSRVDSSQVPDITISTQNEYEMDSHEGMQFEDSVWYEEKTYSSYDSYEDDWDDDWDSDYDWDSGDSWDSGGTDWDSDW